MQSAWLRGLGEGCSMRGISLWVIELVSNTVQANVAYSIRTGWIYQALLSFWLDHWLEKERSRSGQRLWNWLDVRCKILASLLEKHATWGSALSKVTWCWSVTLELTQRVMWILMNYSVRLRKLEELHDAVQVDVDHACGTASTSFCEIGGLELSIAPARPPNGQLAVGQMTWIPYGERICHDAPRAAYCRRLASVLKSFLLPALEESEIEGEETEDLQQVASYSLPIFKKPGLCSLSWV